MPSPHLEDIGPILSETDRSSLFTAGFVLADDNNPVVVLPVLL